MSKRFFACLTGAEEVPAVQTKATGTFKAKLIDEGTRLRYQLTIENIINPLFAHLHLAPEGVNGPVIAFLFSGPILKKPAPPNDTILVVKSVFKGILTNDDLRDPLNPKTIRQLVREIEAGNIYVNVHTSAHPSGEIRGQVEEVCSRHSLWKDSDF